MTTPEIPNYAQEAKELLRRVFRERFGAWSIKRSLFIENTLASYLKNGFTPEPFQIHHLTREHSAFWDSPTAQEAQRFFCSLYGEGNFRMIAVSGKFVHAENTESGVASPSKGFLPFVNDAGREYFKQR